MEEAGESRATQSCGIIGYCFQSLHIQIRMRTDYLVWFAQIHAEFRIPELLSMSDLYNFSIHFPGPVRDLDTSRPFMIFALDEEEHAKILARRCILIKWVTVFLPS